MLTLTVIYHRFLTEIKKLVTSVHTRQEKYKVLL